MGEQLLKQSKVDGACRYSYYQGLSSKWKSVLMCLQPLKYLLYAEQLEA